MLFKKCNYRHMEALICIIGTVLRWGKVCVISSTTTTRAK